MEIGAVRTNAQGVAQDLWFVGGRANVANGLEVWATDPVSQSRRSYATRTVTTASKIAFWRFLGDTNYEIYALRPDGSHSVRLTYSGALDVEPTWSADGRKIAWVSDEGGMPSIHLMNADGSGQMRVGNTLGSWQPALSPDGGQIAASGGPDGWYIYVVNADGTSLRRLTRGSAEEHEPAWSPDGGKIAFDRAGQGIVIINADGSGERALTAAAGGNMPAWSPDGSTIAFAGQALGQTGLFLMNADGSNVRRVTDSYARYPTWSPDGGSIAFGSSGINVIKADGSGLTRLTGPTMDEDHPTWSGCTAR